MSYTTIDKKTTVQVWMRAGGRCEYRGCNKPLWRDDTLLWRLNRAYLAHIIADSPNGPRGDTILSEHLKSDFSNIMLLCDEHHRLIDREGRAEHPVELLRSYKQEHEERIERLTSIQPHRKTEVLLFSARIGERTVLPSFEQVQTAIAPERYPVSERGIRIGLSELEIHESDPGYWEWATKQIDRKLAVALADGVGPSGVDLNHLSIFAAGPIPLLIYLGSRLGDTIASDVYQLNREQQSWAWRDAGNDGFSYTTTSPQTIDPAVNEVVVCLSLSGRIQPAEVLRAVGEGVPIYEIAIANPGLDFLRAKEHLELFRAEWRRVLTAIREMYGGDSVIHLFPAIPNSVAVILGQVRLPKVDPQMVIYDHSRRDGGFISVMTI